MTDDTMQQDDDVPVRRCRSCGVTQPLDAAHFRPQRYRPHEQLLYAKRCQTCDAAAAQGTLPSTRERIRAWRLAQAAAAPPERPDYRPILRARAERARAQGRAAIRRRRAAGEAEQTG